MGRRLKRGDLRYYRGGGVLSDCSRHFDLCIPATFTKPRAPIKSRKFH